MDEDITNAELETPLFPDKYKSGCRYVEPDRPYIHRELAKLGVTTALLWKEYCRKCHEAGETPYVSTRFGGQVLEMGADDESHRAYLAQAGRHPSGI